MIASSFLGGFEDPGTTAAVAQLAPLVCAVEAELETQTRSTVATVESVGTVTLSGGGKRLRPALAALAAFATGQTVDDGRLVKLGTALELVHMATLIHDDVIDESQTRRGRPTAASLHGNTAAILSGDVLLARAMRLLALDGDLEVIRAVSEAVVNLAEGEVLELEARGVLHLDRTNHLRILEKKTAALISCSAHVGSLVAGADAKVQTAVTAYGHHLGMAFQIADDILDFRGDHRKTGKPWATDFREGQSTLPLVFLLDHLSSDETSFVESLFGGLVKDSDLDQICGWMHERGAFDQASLAAREASDKAIKCLQPLEDTPYRSLLTSVARFVVDRES